VSIHAVAAGLRGSCIRGFFWALFFEGISLTMLAVLIFGFCSLRH
jgi:hypothetical protein